MTQLLFAVEDDCFAGAPGAEPTPVTVAGLEGLHLEPYDDDSLVFYNPGETTAAHGCRSATERCASTSGGTLQPRQTS